MTAVDLRMANLEDWIAMKQNVREQALTEQELDWLQEEAEAFSKEGRDYRPSAEFYDGPARLVAEVRRLREERRSGPWPCGCTSSLA